jgi:uncharacterized membrane protein
MKKAAADFFSREEKEDIRQAILNAELDTSGEIRVHIETNCPGDVLDRAAYLFDKLNMSKTHMRNGVLFYLALRNRKFAVIGDRGIHTFVQDDFWEGLKIMLLNHFREGRFAQGLIEGVSLVGVKLKTYFPYKTGDINELPDDITFGA